MTYNSDEAVNQHLGQFLDDEDRQLNEKRLSNKTVNISLIGLEKHTKMRKDFSDNLNIYLLNKSQLICFLTLKIWLHYLQKSGRRL